MDKQKDDNAMAWIAIPVCLGLAAFSYAQGSPENYQQVMTWVNLAVSMIKWATEPQADIPVQAVAPAIASTGLSAIAQIGFLIGGFMIVSAGYIALAGRLKGGNKDSTLQGSPTDEPFDKAASLARKQLASAVGPVVGIPKQRTSLMRSGARLVR